MKTLIIPCAGNRKINKKPLILNMHPDGTILAEKSISGIHPEQYDRVIYTILDEIEKEYNVSEKLKKSVGVNYPVEICILQNSTSGPADTVYETLEKMNVEGEFAVRDSLNYINVSENLSGNFIAGLDLTRFDDEVYRVRTKSFIILNEQNQVLDVVEKKFRSDVISVGLYGFKSVDDYMLAYSKLKDKNYPIKKLYLSHIISYLIGYKNRVFKCDIATKHEDWGAEETWRHLQSNYKLCFVNVDKICGREFKVEALILKILGYKNYEKKSFVLYTSNDKLDDADIKNKFVIAGINCLGIIHNAPLTESVEIINDEINLSHAMLEG